jgi:hypothetical protein
MQSPGGAFEQIYVTRELHHLTGRRAGVEELG